MKAGYIDEDKYQKMISVYLREQRERLNLSYSALAKAARISSSRLKKFEAGEVKLRPHTLDKLKNPLQLDDSHLEKIAGVAKIAFIENLIQLINFNPSGPEKDSSDE